MKLRNILICPALAGLLLGAGTGMAQVSADGLGKVLPVELFACSFRDGKGIADFNQVVERWNAYMDDNDADSYAAWILRPYFYGPEQEFDLLWLGAWRDGNAMGEGQHDWIANGGELTAAFFEVVDCDAHLAFSSAMYKAPAGNNPPPSGLITMMDCSLNEGHKYEEIQAAELKWVDHLEKTGSKAAYYHWRPLFGGGGADFDYKVVFSYPDFREIGADFERIANGGGRAVSMEVFADIDECDDARVYVANSVRSAKIRD